MTRFAGRAEGISCGLRLNPGISTSGTTVTCRAAAYFTTSRISAWV